MAVITEFPDLAGRVIQGVYGDDVTYTAEEAILAGQIVEISTTGGVKKSTGTGNPVGVAIADAAIGSLVTVRVSGIVYCANDGTAAIVGGAFVKAGTLGGIVAGTTKTIGQTLEAIPTGGVGRVKISTVGGA